MADQKGTNKLCGTSLTIDWLVQTLKRTVSNADSETRLEAWEARKIAVAEGPMSDIIQVGMKWDKQNSIPGTVILKVPALDTIAGRMASLIEQTNVDKEEFQKFLAHSMLPEFHARECTLYDMFQQTAPAAPVPVPQIWYTQAISPDNPGVIVMEDLSETGRLQNLCEGLNMGQLQSVAESLASLHSYSMRYQGRWENKLPLQSKEFFGGFKFTEMMQLASYLLTELKPEFFQGKLEKIAHIFDIDMMYETLISHEELDLPPVIVHGDMWCNNLLFRKMPDGAISDQLLAIIDWQLVHPGNLAQDLASLLISSTTCEIRRKHTQDILNLYYDYLAQKMPNGQVPFGIKKVYEAYEKALPYGMFFYLLFLPLYISSPMVDGENRNERIDELLTRGKCILDEVIELGESKNNN